MSDEYLDPIEAMDDPEVVDLAELITDKRN